MENNRVIFLEPLYKEYIWGGKNLKSFLNRDVEGKIAESWEVSAYKSDSNIIKTEKFEGKKLLDVFESNKEMFGNFQKFPVLIKFIDANDKLSIQVHPNDEYAQEYENDSGKNEVWYILDCKENAKIILGINNNKLQDKGNEELVENIEEYINYVNVKKGDFIQIPAGTVHAILDGIIICEIQQNSNVTYRIHDWNRKDKNGKSRELHKQKAIDVININNNPAIINYENESNNKKIYESKEFNIDLLNVTNTIHFDNKDFFEIYTVIEGNGILKDGTNIANIQKGDVFLVPINCEEAYLEGKLKILKTHFEKGSK